MLSIIYAALLAAGVVSAAEFLYILVTCGPFWLRPLDFFLAWGVYTLPILTGLIFILLISSPIPPLRNWLKDPIHMLTYHFTIGFLMGGTALVVIILNESGNTSTIWLPIVLILFLGCFTAFLAVNVLSKKPESSSQPLWLVIFLIIVVNGAYLFNDLSYAAKVKARSSVFQGDAPHLSLVVLNATRRDHFSCYGYPYKTTPNFDRIALEGVLCHNAFSASNWTPPGIISIFTGTYPSQHGNEGKPYKPDELVTLTELLRQEGYFCVALYNNPLAGRDINLTQGFDVDAGVFLQSWVQPAWVRLRDKLTYMDSGAMATFPIALRTSQWVEKRGGHLFLYLNLSEPHRDYVIHEPYFTDLTEDLVFDHIPNMDEVKAQCASREDVVYDSTKFSNYNRASYRYLEAVYDSEIAYMDAQFGLYSEGLRKSGLLDKTLMVITADHAEFLGERFTIGHPDLMYNPVLRIPLMFRYPETIEPRVEMGYVSNVDILPTVLSLMSYDQLIPNDVQGLDLFHGYPLNERILLAERIRGQNSSIAFIDPDYKLIMNTDPEMLAKNPPDTLLYNLKIDPKETEDLHQQDEALTLKMIDEMDEWRSQIYRVPEANIELNERVLKDLRTLGYTN